MNDLKDWPRQLRRNVAICELAKAMFTARGECYGGSLDLTDQPAHIRSAYMVRAEEFLKTVAPGTVVPFSLEGA